MSNNCENIAFIIYIYIYEAILWIQANSFKRIISTVNLYGKFTLLKSVCIIVGIE